VKPPPKWEGLAAAEPARTNAFAGETTRCLREMVPFVEYRDGVDLKRMLAAIKASCFASGGGDAAGGALPFVIGRSAQLGHEVELIWKCDGACDPKTAVLLAYREIDAATCCRQRGAPLRETFTSGAYQACMPPFMMEPALATKSCAELGQGADPAPATSAAPR